MINGRNFLGGSGGSSSAIATGGNSPSPACALCTESWNGTSWSTSTALPDGRALHASAGSSSSAIVFGSYGNGCTLQFNGTTWSSTTGMISPRSGLSGVGGSCLAASAAGGDFPNTNCTECFNGGAWSSKAAMIAGRRFAAASTQANFYDHFTYGGYYAGLESTSTYWDGNIDTWSLCASMINAKQDHSGHGGYGSALSAGGSPTSTCTEEYS